MRKVLSIIKKNFKLIVRSKISALIILFGPLLIMLIVGLAFNSSAAIRINVGYFTPNYNNLTASFVQVLKDSNYTVTPYRDQEECNLSIQEGASHICIGFPASFEISNQQKNEVIFMVDNSKINFFETVVDSIEKSFNDRALQLTQGMTQELLNRLNETSESILDKASTLEQLKSENALLKQDVETISDEVGDLDLDFSYNDLGMDDLEDASDDVAKGFRELRGIAEDAIETADEMMDNLEEQLDIINSSETADLYELINDTRGELQSLLGDINKTKGINTTGLSSKVNSLKNDIRDVESRFAEASNARDLAVKNIKSINEKLDSSMAKITAVETTFNAITASIQGTEVTDLEAITKPITKKVEKVVSQENQLNFYFPYLVVLIIMFIGLLLSSTLSIMEKTSKAYFRNFVTPTSDLVFVFGSYLTTLLVMILQLFVILGIFAFYFQRSDISSNFGSTFLVLGLLVTLFSWMGMTIGNIFNSEETGTLASVSVGSILLFISDLIFPLERMPDTVEHLARTYNPFVIGTEMLRKTMVLDVPFGDLGSDLYLVVSYLALFFTVMLLSHKIMKKSYLLRWGGYVARRELRHAKQAKEVERLLEAYKNIQEPFITKDEKKITSFKDLEAFISGLSEEDFRHYVNEHQNMVADWVEKNLQNDTFSLKMRNAKKKTVMVREMKKALKSYESMQSRTTKKKFKWPFKRKQ